MGPNNSIPVFKNFLHSLFSSFFYVDQLICMPPIAWKWARFLAAKKEYKQHVKLD